MTSNTLIKVRGIVVFAVMVNEKDKILTLFTQERGLIGVYASGSRNVKSRLLAAADLFCYADYVLSVKGDRYSVREAELIESFYGLRNDIVRISFANYLCEVVRTVGTENLPDPPFLRLLLNTLYATASGKYEVPHIKAAFEVRAASLLGFCPDLSGCANCGKEDGEFFLEVLDGNMLCSDCRNVVQNDPAWRLEMEGHRTVLCILTPAVLASWRYCLSCPQERLLAFRLENEHDRMLFYRSAEEYLLNHLDRGFQSLTFYRMMLGQTEKATDEKGN